MAERTSEEAEIECRVLRTAKVVLEQRVMQLESTIKKAESSGSVGGSGLKVCPWCGEMRGNTGMAGNEPHATTCAAFKPDGFLK